mgnify:CR=1 FL=1
MANTDVPADTFPVRTATELVATIPVPASPSGGASNIPLSRLPLTSSLLAPSSVSVPAFSPAVSTFGRMSLISHGYSFTLSNAANLSSIAAS